jgi:putative transposase
VHRPLRCQTSTRRSSTIEAWGDRPIEGKHPHVWRGVQRVTSSGDRREDEGYREILGICEGAKEDKADRSVFLRV